MQRLITAALPYVNSEPHMGNFLAILAGDTYKRYLALNGQEALLLLGTDDNSKKIVQAAKLSGIPVKDFLKRLQNGFVNSCFMLDVAQDYFVRTSDAQHHEKVTDIYHTLKNKGLIYEGVWHGFLDPGTGEMHSSFKPGLQQTTEKCLYFKWNHLSPIVENYLKSIGKENLVKDALEWMEWDTCITSKTNYGVEVPGYPELRFYVWWDALISYIEEGTCIDTQFFGKDITKFHSVMQIALLHSLGLELPKRMVINQHLIIGKTKLSKSSCNHTAFTLTSFVGQLSSYEGMSSNIVFEVFRLTCLKVFSTSSDVSVTSSYIKELYNSLWANNFGNLFQRVSGLTKKLEIKSIDTKCGVGLEVYADVQKSVIQYRRLIENFNFQELISEVNLLAIKANKYFQKEEGWNLEGEELNQFLVDMCFYLRTLQGLIQPLSPKTSKRISNLVNFEEWKTWENMGLTLCLPSEIVFSEKSFPLFPRIR